MYIGLPGTPLLAACTDCVPSGQCTCPAGEEFDLTSGGVCSIVVSVGLGAIGAGSATFGFNLSSFGTSFSGASNGSFGLAFGGCTALSSNDFPGGRTGAGGPLPHM